MTGLLERPVDTEPDLDERVRWLLNRARDGLALHGWAQDEYRTPSGRMCLVGALIWAAGASPERSLIVEVARGHPDFGAALRRLASTIEPRRDFGDFYAAATEVVGWNDMSGRTKSEVFEVLAKAAAE